MIKQVLILVGGKGTRLGDLTHATPKPMLEVAPNLSFLSVVIENFARQGFKDILLLAGFCGEMIENAWNGKTVFGANIKVIIEPEPMGTGGAIFYAREYLDDWFLVTNGDSFFDFNMRDFARPKAREYMGKIALRQIENASRYGLVRLEGEKIIGFSEKNPEAKTGLINAGTYLFSRKILEFINGKSSIETDIFPILANLGQLNGQIFSGYFIDMGLPDSYKQSQKEIPALRNRPCLFLDRDGVINEDQGYTFRPEDLKFLPGIIEAIKLANDKGYFVIVISNQAGVAYGKYSENDVEIFHQEINEQLAIEGAYIDGFYYCPFHKEAKIAKYFADDHPDRKPNAGMIFKAFADWPINKNNSFMIGDKQHDVIAAQNAGIKGVLFEGGNLKNLIELNLN